MTTEIVTPKAKGSHLPHTKAQREQAASIRESILTDLAAAPDQDLRRLAAKHGSSYDLVYRLRRAVLGAKAGMDRSQEWGDLLSRDIPLKLRSRTMRDIIKSNNPVAAARMLELVLESDGLRKKLPEPKVQSTIIVQATDDVGFE